jgi:2',3'-cyclic-nucleotide 2'-phosphodiesterase (5'-nucleotidase family)
MKKSLILLPLVALFLVGCNGDNNDGPLPPPVVVDPNNEQLSGQPKDGDIIKIIHMNDTHGAIEYLPDANEPGMARVAGYVNAKRAEEKTDVVLVSSGDMFQGSLDSNINQGKLMIDIMKEMRFDSMSIGNHEFDWGPDVLSDNAAYAMNLEEGDWAFPFLSGKILNPEGQYDFGYLSTTFNRGGARVSVIGSIDSGVYNSIDAAVVEGFSFENATNMVIAEAERLRVAGSDIIIYSTHDANKEVDSKIALYVDAVFTGHSHYDSIATMVGADSKVVPVIESFENGKVLGEVDFVYDAESDSYQLDSYKNINPLSVTPLVEDEGVKAIYDLYLDSPVQDGPVSSDSLRALKTDKIGEITSESDFASGDVISSSNVRKMFIIAQLEAYIDEYDVIASSYNEARSSWAVGDITYSDIYKAFPFDNATVVVEATGSQLRRWNTAMEFAAGNDKYSLTPSTMYRVVTSSFVINNKESYNYTSIVHTDENLFQRHVFYQAFIDAGAPNPWG